MHFTATPLIPPPASVLQPPSINGTLRYEGSNRLGKSRSARWLPTWNVSGRWNISDEPWMRGLQPVLSHAVLKASYSLTAESGPSWVTNSNVVISSYNPWRPTPGEQETLKRRPFVGKAGKNLDEFLQLMGMERETLYVSNVVKIRPTSLGKTGRVRNRAPSKEEIALFLPFLMKEIDLVKPQCLVTLGNVPLKALMGPKATVGDLHGRWHTAANGLPLFALYHPAAIIYRRELKEVYAQDVLQLKASLTIGTSK